MASGKASIVSAINTKGGSSTTTESFQELAEDITELPVFYENLKLFALLCQNPANNASEGLALNEQYGYNYILDEGLSFQYEIQRGNLFGYWSLLKRVTLKNVKKITQSGIFRYCTSLEEVNLGGLEEISQKAAFFQNCNLLKTLNIPHLKIIKGDGGSFLGQCAALEILYIPELQEWSGNGQNDLAGCYALREIILPKVTILGCLNWLYQSTTILTNLVLGSLTTLGNATLRDSQRNLRNITIGQDTDIDLIFAFWTAQNVIAEGAAAITELNDNLYNNLLTKLYDHSQDGVTRTLRIGWLSNVSAENIAYANAKGWTLTT